MRNKKYRCWEMILLLLVMATVSFGMLSLVGTREERILLIVCGTGFILGTIILFPLYFEVKDDRIVTRFGVESLDKRYRGSFRKRVFMLDDVRDIYIEDNKMVHITLKGGIFARVPIASDFYKKEICELVDEIRAQIKGYEQNK